MGRFDDDTEDTGGSIATAPDIDRTEAALRAGLTTSRRAAKQRAYEMLQRDDVDRYIAEAIEERSRRIEA